MNQVSLTGRLTKDPEIRYVAANQKAVAKFSIAIERLGEKAGTDYPNIVCFGKTAELVERYLGKGRLVGITGRLQTGSYEKDGRRVYTTDVIADRVEFLDKAAAADEQKAPAGLANPFDDVPSGFDSLDDVPF